MQVLPILNDPPYGTERTYNGLRLALALAKNDPATRVTAFLMADAVVAAKSGQKTPEGPKSPAEEPPSPVVIRVRSPEWSEVEEVAQVGAEE